MHLPPAPRPAGLVRLLAVCATVTAVLLVSLSGTPGRVDRAPVVPVGHHSDSDDSSDSSDSDSDSDSD